MAQPLRALDSDRIPEPEDIFADAVTWRNEQAKRKVLDGKLADMKTQLTRISNFTSMMAQTSVPVGDDPSVRLFAALPSSIDGDSITGMSSTELRKALSEKPASEVEGVDRRQSAPGCSTRSPTATGSTGTP